MAEHAVYEPFTGKIPAGASVSQLTKPLELGSVNYYGWEMYYTKQIPTGKKDKKGKDIKKSVVDDQKPFMYDDITQQFQNNTALAALIASNANMKSTLASIITELVLLKSQRGGNK